MKNIVENCFITLLTVWLLMTSSALAMSGGDYEISWSTIDGGGGRSTGGDFALVGTIGQPDAGEMSISSTLPPLPCTGSILLVTKAIIGAKVRTWITTAMLIWRM